MKARIARVMGMMVAGLLAATMGPVAFADDDAAGPSPTFNREIVRIFQAKCQSCHREGDIGPMSLITYEETRPWAKSIRQTVADGTMPPWHADPSVGTFRNDGGLSKDQSDAIARWVDAGAPEGDPADLPAPRSFGTDGWRFGPPDLVFEMPEPYTVAADVRDETRCFVIETNLEHDVWAKGGEHHPGNARVVHHIVDFLDATDKSLKLDAADPKPGYECSATGFDFSESLGGWAPGSEAFIERDGIAVPLKKGRRIVMQVHYYNSTGVDQADRTSFGVYLATAPVKQIPKTTAVSAWLLKIPPGEANVEHRAQWKTNEDVTITSIMPHMHFLGKDMTVTFEPPGGAEAAVLAVPRYDFNWQRTYEFAEPIKAPKGSFVRMVSHHDNSENNPANPTSPPKAVRFGEATDDEMAIAWVNYLADAEDVGVVPQSHPRNWTQTE